MEDSLVGSTRKLVMQVWAIVLVLLLFGCSEDKSKMEKRDSMSNKSTPSEWDKLAKKRIFFGHQSVGMNILDGIKDVAQENQNIKLKVTEIGQQDLPSGPVFIHSAIGRNSAPLSKCNAFAEKIEKLGGAVDIAISKFCYIDFTAETNSAEVFESYKQTISKLKAKYPKITFVHMTVPLSALQTGPKAWVKQLIGRPITGREDNVNKTIFNELIKSEYTGKDPIFDLAKIESTYPNGELASITVNGKSSPFLVPDYTYDDGHLNEKGRKVVAEKFLLFLAGL